MKSKDKHIGLSIFLSILIYLLYLEINPKITGIWLRRDYTNTLRLTSMVYGVLLHIH